jgi:hypothetical protein
MPLPARQGAPLQTGRPGAGFVGEDAIDHTPRDEEVRLKVGDAFDIVGERTQMSFRQVGERATRRKSKSCCATTKTPP